MDFYLTIMQLEGYLVRIGQMSLVSAEGVSYNSNNEMSKNKSHKSKVSELIISELPCASVSKRVLVQIRSHQNEFGLHEN